MQIITLNLTVYLKHCFSCVSSVRADFCLPENTLPSPALGKTTFLIFKIPRSPRNSLFKPSIFCKADSPAVIHRHSRCEASWLLLRSATVAAPAEFGRSSSLWRTFMENFPQRASCKRSISLRPWKTHLYFRRSLVSVCILQPKQDTCFCNRLHTGTWGI